MTESVEVFEQQYRARCGSGANLCDGSQTAIDLAQRRLDKWNVSANLSVGLFDALPYDDQMFDVVCDVVSLQHATIEQATAAFREILRVLKPGGGRFFSFRLSDASLMYRPDAGEWLDAATVKNITDTSMPLANNGVTSFWSPVLTRMMYSRAGFEEISIERIGRTYDNGAKYVEYLAIAGRRPV